MANMYNTNNNASLYSSNGSSFGMYFAVPCCGFFWNPSSDRIRSGENVQYTNVLLKFSGSAEKQIRSFYFIYGCSSVVRMGGSNPPDWGSIPWNRAKSN